MSDKTFKEIFNDYIEVKKIWSFEGERGVQKLCGVVKDLGYKDPTQFGSHKHGSYGDLICFLEDNPEACNALIKWIEDNGDDSEWFEKLQKIAYDDSDDSEM